MPTERQRQYMDQTHTYIRMFCGSLCGSSFLMMICTSPLNWVQFLVTKNGLELSAGLWTLCNHELCWGHTPKSPCECRESKCHGPHSFRAFYHIGLWSFSSSPSPAWISAILGTWPYFPCALSPSYPSCFPIPNNESRFFSEKNSFVIYKVLL
jgi:hypothetical protein